jgi:glycosyltransferase involved in cell wall biosynthesis
MPGKTAETVLFVGRLRTRKAVAVLVEAFAAVVRQRPQARLVLLGDGEQRAALEAQIARLGIGAAVDLAGAVPRAATVEWLRRADVFCLPSTYEGFPLAILEAMAEGLPVVATRVAGVPEAVEDGASGLLVPPEDDRALAAALLALLGDAERRRAFGARGRALLAERFAIDAICARHLALFARLSDTGRSGLARDAAEGR